MNAQQLLDKIKELPNRPVDVPTAPPVELVAMVVRWSRHLKQWKATTLADFARVSLSTVERVERGDKVSDEALDRVAQALGYERGAFTTPRLPIGPENAAEEMVEIYGHLEPVAVAPMKTHKAIRDAAKCQAYLIHRPDVPDTYDADIAALGEWLDLGSFILSDIDEDPSPSERGRRDLYNDILKCVGELERRGLTVLSGVMAAPQPGLPDWKVAIVSVTPRLTDPGAPKRRHLMVDRRCVALPPNALSDGSATG
ncbi:helix-turn-helix transcriptional regulator [Xanthobacter sp.]|uniref:helix-turn-helix domain-containing protein n=1 Tax=Xanthobacter sp. TaxID=35809 RepID=UPI0025E1B048|nr:helix-turn-helix transcriptional regulator [Xanthobacter sp.]